MQQLAALVAPSLTGAKGSEGLTQAELGNLRSPKKPRMGNDEESRPGTKKALRRVDFSSMEEAKKDFLSKNGNGRKCFWACSPIGRMVGGCQYDKCKFKATHPKKGPG
jgi:hypothetical protein